MADAKAKSDTVSYLEEKGITVGKKLTYAVKRKDRKSGIDFSQYIVKRMKY